MRQGRKQVPVRGPSMSVLRSAIVAGPIVAILIALAPAADAGSLYHGPGPRPGPDILYSSAPVAPQLQNTGPWKAPPILVSGAEAYRGGEFLYQDYLYDDSGRLGRDGTPPDRRASPARRLESGDLGGAHGGRSRTLGRRRRHLPATRADRHGDAAGRLREPLSSAFQHGIPAERAGPPYL